LTCGGAGVESGYDENDKDMMKSSAFSREWNVAEESASEEAVKLKGRIDDDE